MNNQIFGLISIAVGICVGVYFVWAMKRQLATGKWIIAKGQVLESRILDHGSSLEPYVKYNYTVRGETYISDRISPNKYTCQQVFLKSNDCSVSGRKNNQSLFRPKQSAICGAKKERLNFWGYDYRDG